MCASSRSYESGAVGAGLGGIAGALIDNKNPWRGGVIGATLVVAASAAITDLLSMVSKEAAVSGRPIEYRTALRMDMRFIARDRLPITHRQIAVKYTSESGKMGI